MNRLSDIAATTIQRRGFFILLLGLLALSLSAATAQTTAFYYDSGQNGSWVAANANNVTVNPGFDWVFEQPTKSSFDEAWQFEITFGGGSSWRIDIELPNGAPIATGNYLGSRYPFNADFFPGFDWGGFGRGLNTLTAEFDILEVTFNPDDSIASIAFDFTQWEETNGEFDIPTLESSGFQSAFGSFRYNSSLPTNTISPRIAREAAKAALVRSIKKLKKKIKKLKKKRKKGKAKKLSKKMKNLKARLAALG